MKEYEATLKMKDTKMEEQKKVMMKEQEAAMKMKDKEIEDLKMSLE